MRSYPVIDRHGFVWIWMGVSEQADPGLIPDFSFLEDQNLRAGPVGYLRLDANYQLAADNLLDLTHIQFLHGSTLGSDAVSDGMFQVTVGDDTVTAKRTVQDAAAPAQAERRYPIQGRPVDLLFETRWSVPGVMRQRTGVCLAGARWPRAGRTWAVIC